MHEARDIHYGSGLKSLFKKVWKSNNNFFKGHDKKVIKSCKILNAGDL